MNGPLVFPLAAAQWSEDPNMSGSPVCEEFFFGFIFHLFFISIFLNFVFANNWE